MYYANAKEKDVSELHGDVVERYTFVFLIVRETMYSYSSNPYTSL